MSMKTLIVIFIASLLIFSCGIILLLTSRDTGATLAEVKQIQPSSSEEFQSTASNSPVVLIGKIDPKGPVVEEENNLAIALEEEYRSSRDSRGRRTSKWEKGRRMTPPFTLLVDSDPVEITNQDYELKQTRFNEPGKTSLGSRRYSGFQRGDMVLIYGTKATTGVHAATVFGGSYPEFVSSLESQASATSILGWILLVVGALPGAGLLYVMVRARRKAPSVVYAGSYDSLAQTSYGQPPQGSYGQPPYNPQAGYGQPPQGGYQPPSDPNDPTRR